MQASTIRNADTEDARQIAEIFNHYIEHTDISFETEPLTEEQMRQRIASLIADGPYLVCEQHGEVLGFAYAHPWKERAAYGRTLETTVYLRTGAERRGLGRALMERLIDECRKRDIHVLVACITAGNDASIALHKALGFTEVSHFREVGRKHGRWLDVIDMQLIL